MKLLKIDGYWIVVSDEKPNASDWYIDFLVFPSLIQYPLQHSGVEYKEDKVNGIYKNPIIQSVQGTTSTKNNCWKVIASQNSEHNLPTITFSDEVAKKLGVVDVKKLGINRAIERNWNPNSMETKRVANEIISATEYGYNQALSDNKDKLFTLEDMKQAFKIGITVGIDSLEEKEGYDRVKYWNQKEDVYIQSLTKQEYNCVLETEPYYTDEVERLEGKNDGENIKKEEIISVINNSVKVIKILK